MSENIPPALQVANMCEEIYTTLIQSKYYAFAPDALFRVFVYLAKKNDWSLERVQEEALKGVLYYYEND